MLSVEEASRTAPLPSSPRWVGVCRCLPGASSGRAQGLRPSGEGRERGHRPPPRKTQRSEPGLEGGLPSLPGAQQQAASAGESPPVPAPLSGRRDRCAEPGEAGRRRRTVRPSRRVLALLPVLPRVPPPSSRFSTSLVPFLHLSAALLLDTEF